MEQKTLLAMIAISSLCVGCGHLNESIRQRVEVSEQCRQAMEVPLPASWVPNSRLASIHLGNVGSCSIGDTDNLLPLCSFEQIKTKYDFNTSPDQLKKMFKPVEDAYYGVPAVAPKDKVAAVGNVPEQPAVKAVAAQPGLRGELMALLDAVAIVEGLDEYKVELGKLKSSNFAERTEMLSMYQSKIGDLKDRLRKLRAAQAKLRAAMVGLNAELGNQARFELAAWDSNLRAQLDQFEQLIAGNYSIVLQDTLKDQVIRHVAKRTLDMLHGSLKAADAVITKLDDKAYGTVSVAYLTLGPSIQRSVNRAFDRTKEVFESRIGKDITEEGEQAKAVKEFFLEVQRAACENMVQGTQFSMLTEVVDTMLITKIGEEYKPVAIPKTTPPAQKKDARITTFASVSTNHAFLYLGETDSGSAVDKATTSPLAVYTAHEWAARQQLLVEKMALKAQGVKASGVGGSVMPFPEIETVDAGAVRHLADAATAKTVDDAARLRPQLLTSADGAMIAASIQNSVNIMTAASAVASASVELTANIRVNNVNTFNPTNNPTIAPVINLPAYALPDRPLSLCSTFDFRGVGATCMVDGSAYVIVFNGDNSYSDDSCTDGDIGTSLAAVAGGLARYRTRYNTPFEATVHGYASLPRATLAKCSAAKPAHASACTHFNSIREKIDVYGCRESGRGADLNLLLSAARAKHAALTLEQASSGAVLVKRLNAKGTQTAGQQNGLYGAQADQTVVIRLQPLAP